MDIGNSSISNDQRSLFDSINFKVYQQSVFLRIIEKVYKLERVDVFESNFRSLGRLTTFYRPKYGLSKRIIFNMPFNFYYSPLLPEDTERNFFFLLEEFSRKNRVNIIIKSLRTYHYGKKVVAAYNPIVFLDNNYRSRYSKNLVKNIKRNRNKAKRHGIEICKAKYEQELEDFYVHVLSFVYIKKHKMVFQPLELFLSLFKENLMDVFIARLDGKVVGGICCIRDFPIYHYNWGASLNISNIAIGTLLIDHAMDYAYLNGYKFFDMGSTPLSDKELLKFKLRWGAENFPVYYYFTMMKPILIDLNSSYKLARYIYSKLPQSLIRWVMPRIVPYLVQ